jgi:hypothetical protein
MRANSAQSAHGLWPAVAPESELIFVSVNCPVKKLFEHAFDRDSAFAVRVLYTNVVIILSITAAKVKKRALMLRYHNRSPVLPLRFDDLCEAVECVLRFTPTCGIIVMRACAS